MTNLAKPCSHDTLVNTINARMVKYVESAGRYERTMEILETALAQQHEASQLKTRLLSMVSHDLRIGLTSILSSEQLIKNYDHKMTADRRMSYLLRIERNVPSDAHHARRPANGGRARGGWCHT